MNSTQLNGISDTQKMKTHSSGFFQRVLSLTFSGWGAKIGAVWVGLLALMAVFAPFIANTIPLMASQNGELVFPFLRYFTIEDTLFLSAFIILLLITFIPWFKSGSKAIISFILLMLIASLLANFLV